MGVTFIAPQGTYTAPAKLVTKEITENGTYDATDDSANGYSSVTVNVEGGGGSSDFSTAEMTLDAGSGFLSGIAINIIYVNVELDTLYFNTVESLPSGTYIVPLYHGNAIAFIDPENNYTVSGNATVDEEGNMAITGDFTVSKP